MIYDLLHHYKGWHEGVVGCAEAAIFMEDEGIAGLEEVLVVRGVVTEGNGVGIGVGRWSGYIEVIYSCFFYPGTDSASER